MEIVKNIKINKNRLLVIALLITSFVFIISSPILAQAFDFNEGSGLNSSANTAGFETGSDAETVDSIVAVVIYAVLGLVGVIFLGLMILSGFKWMIAQGNEEKINKAKDGLLSAMIGLIITLGAYAISYFLIGYFT